MLSLSTSAILIDAPGGMIETSAGYARSTAYSGIPWMGALIRCAGTWEGADDLAKSMSGYWDAGMLADVDAKASF